jgi:type II secretory pathway predicted ATPase ExeA
MAHKEETAENMNMNVAEEALKDTRKTLLPGDIHILQISSLEIMFRFLNNKMEQRQELLNMDVLDLPPKLEKKTRRKWHLFYTHGRMKEKRSKKKEASKREEKKKESTLKR